MGIMVTYGSYVPKSENLAKSAGWICALDTLVAVMAALAIVPVVMITQGEEGLGMGGGFAFISLPAMFGVLPGGPGLGPPVDGVGFRAALPRAHGADFRFHRSAGLSGQAHRLLGILNVFCLYQRGAVIHNRSKAYLQPFF